MFVARKPSILSLFNPVFSIAKMHTACNATCQTFCDIYIWNICGGKPPSIRGVLIEVAIRWSPNQLTYLPSLIWLLDKYISQFRLIGFSKFTAYGKSHVPQFFWTLPLNGNWNGCIIWIAAAKIPVPVKFQDKSENPSNESGKVTFSSKIFESLQQNLQFHF